MKYLYLILFSFLLNIQPVKCQDKSGLFIVDYNVLEDAITDIKYADTIKNIRYDIGLNNGRSYFSILCFHDSEDIERWDNFENGMLTSTSHAQKKNRDSSLIYIREIKSYELGLAKTVLRYNDAHQLVEAKLKEDKKRFLHKREVIYWHKYFYSYCFPLKITMDVDRHE